VDRISAKALRAYLTSGGDLDAAARVVQDETKQITFDYDVLPMIYEAAEMALPGILAWAEIAELLTALARHADLVEDLRRIRATGKLLFESIDRHAGGPLEKTDEETGKSLGLDAQATYFLAKGMEGYASAVAKLDQRLEAVSKAISRVGSALRRQREYVAAMESHERRQLALRKFGGEMARDGKYQPMLAIAEAYEVSGGADDAEAVFDAWEAGRQAAAADRKRR
jgi:hypothetical protein